MNDEMNPTMPEQTPETDTPAEPMPETDEQQA